jgi:glycosyltransferase involved in cell wall biosynthesis
VLLVDRALAMLPESLAGTCEQVTTVSEAAVGRYSVLVQPSPMTSSPAPLVPLLHSSAHKITIVFDFIPMHYPSVYLAHAGSRVEYAAALDALGFYDEFVCISHMVAAEVGRVLGRSNLETSVAWPANVGIETKTRPGTPTGPIVIMTGDEGRKNTYGALAAIALATAGQEAPRDVLVIGMAGLETRVHHWSIHAAMRPGEAVTAGRLTDAEMRDALNTASVVLVPSFDEGLSLPVIEALSSGANVVASDIPAHRELIGSGPYLVDPKNLKKFAKVIRKYAGTRRSYPRQVTRLMSHDHRQLETVIGQSALRNLGKTGVGIPASRAYIVPANFSVGMATPWPPQRSGVADYSEAVGIELNKLCDLTVYTTADAQVGHGIKSGRISDVRAHGSSHDAFVSVIGNSHFHLPMIDLLGYIDSAAILHDTRMIEFYAALRGRGGAEQLMVRGQASRVIAPAFDEQLNDLRLLQNAGMWEIAQQAKPLIMHSTMSAPRIEAETGVVPQMLPFANYRSPSEAIITEEMREAARNRLGLDPSVKHIASFGFIDIRTKLSDVIIEAAAWLSQWGHDVHLHLVGSATAPIAEELQTRARQAGLSRFTITGYVSDEQYRDYVLAIDVGLQLRISQFLGVAGALSDMAAYGTTAMGSHGLAVDVDTPPYIDRLPDEVSPLMVAEALEYRLANPVPAAEREEQRRTYLAAKSPHVYAERLLAILRENS